MELHKDALDESKTHRTFDCWAQSNVTTSAITLARADGDVQELFSDNGNRNNNVDNRG